MRYEYLMSPIKIAGVTLKNRYAVSAIAANSVQRGPWGELTENCLEFRGNLARGGFGLFVTNSNYPDLVVDKLATNACELVGTAGDKVVLNPPPTSVTSPYYVPAAFNQTARRMLERMHAHDTKVFMQIAFGPGRVRGSKSPSKMPVYWNPGQTTTVITTEEIKSKIHDMVRCAKTAQDLGYDGVEVHALHWGYALDQFSIPWMNDRTDEYGSDTWDKRLAIPREVVQGIKEVCGKDFPVSVALGLKHFMAGYNKGTLTGEGEVGRSLEDAIIIAQKLEEYGYDMLDCDAGCYEAYYYSNPPYYLPKCQELYLAKAVKKAVNIPVFMTGKMTDPDICEQAIANGELDGVSLGRAAMVDPDYPNKILRGAPETIRPCTCCGDCLDTMNTEGLPKCALKPNLFLEATYTLGYSIKSKRVAVVGGGVSGMAAAEYITQRGHKVDLYEAGDELGGQLLDEGYYAFKQDVMDLRNWYVDELARLGVQVFTGVEATPEYLVEKDYDVVVLATGSEYIAPTVPGGESGKVVALADAIYDNVAMGEKVVVYGGDLAGAELAYEMAVNRGKKVVLVEERAEILLTKPMTGKPVRDMLLALIEREDIEVITGAVVTRVTETGIEILKDGAVCEIAADNVVFSLGVQSRPTMQKALASSGVETYCVGDAVKPGSVRACVTSAFEVAKGI